MERTETAAPDPTLCTHVVMREMRGLDPFTDEERTLKPGELVDATFWKRHHVEDLVEKRRMEALPQPGPEEAARRALKRAATGRTRLDRREAELNAEGAQLDETLARLRKRMAELDKLLVERGECVRDDAAAQRARANVNTHLDRLPAQRERYENERQRGEMFALVAGVKA